MAQISKIVPVLNLRWLDACLPARLDPFVMTMTAFLEILLLFVHVALATGSLLNLSSSPHWFVRGWDFPRVQIVAIGWTAVGLVLLLRGGWGDATSLPDGLFVSIAGLLTAWHGFRILPYTPLMPKQVRTTLDPRFARTKQACYTPLMPKQVRTTDPYREGDSRSTDGQFRLVVSNVELENDQFDRWLSVMQSTEADVLIVLEIDERWVEAAAPLFERYPHRVIYPQTNWYGMMLLSRLPIEHHTLQFLVQQDVPSIDARVRLDNGERVRLVAVHPRPPEPWRGNDAVPRDAELTLWGEELADDTGPTIIGGDLNDVAWSATTRLFLRTSGLLDPRRGRGFFNRFTPTTGIAGFRSIMSFIRGISPSVS